MALPASSQALRVYQWGKETTRGTAVPATSKIAAVDVDLEPQDMLERPSLAKGLLIGNRGNETPVMRGTKITIPDSPINYEQFQNVLSMSVKGGVTATGLSPYVWTYARSLTADPAPNSWTIERRLSDGTNNIDTQFAYCLFDSWTIKGATNKLVTWGATGFGRRVQTHALTSAQTMPTPEQPPQALCVLDIDSTWANLGVTPMATQIYGFEVKFDTGLIPFYTMDNRSDLDFTTHEVDATKIKLAVKILALVTNGGAFAAEKTAAEAATLRAVRILASGTSSRALQIDMLLKHKLGSVFKVGTLNGQDIVQFDMEESNDGTNFLAVTLTNLIATQV